MIGRGIRPGARMQMWQLSRNKKRNHQEQFDNDIGLGLLEQLVQNEMISLPIGLIDH